MASPEPYYQDDHVTIYNGDACELVGQLAAESDVIVTDPPYGMAFRSSRGGAFGASGVAGDDDTATRDSVLATWGVRPALVFGRWSVERPAGTRMVLTWDKGEHVGMGDLALPWKPNTEEVYVLGSGFVGHRGGSVLRHLAIAGTVGQAGRATRCHPTEKPVSLMRELLEKCPPEWVVLDPFMGGGSTLRAAKDLHRRAIGIEVNEAYCRVAALRMGQEVLL